MPNLNATHDDARQNWVKSANVDGSGYPIKYLHYGIFSHLGCKNRTGVAIGDQIYDLTAAEAAELISPTTQPAVDCAD